MTEKQKPKWVEGVGWRYELEHSQKRRSPWHRYNEEGTYLITIVVAGRRPVFGHIAGDIRAKAGLPGSPATVLSPLGERILRDELPKIPAAYPMVQIWKLCIMPDHIHLILHIKTRLPEGKSLGRLVGAFKGGITRAWWRLSGRLTPAEQWREDTQRPPLFEAGYNDRILMRDGQLERWKAYLDDNPRRWLVRKLRPELMQRALCLVINGVRYGSFGNFLLLHHPEKTQVFFHRQMPDEGQAAMVATEETLFWQRERERLMYAAEQGDVLVTPGVSECEKRIKNECLARRLRLIHLQTEPIGEYWKPEKTRFEACAAGSLLILAPWAEDLAGDSDHARFHNLNALAANICALAPRAACRLK